MNRFVPLSLCCLSFLSARANSSTAGYSTKEIRVHSVFENPTREPIETLVAFPFPKFELNRENYSPERDLDVLYLHP